MSGRENRARLLDLGEVSALRSQSLFHAVAAVMQPQDDPALILLRPGAALVTIGRDYAEDTLGGALITAEGLPVFRSLAPGELAFHDSGQLSFYLLVGAGRIDEFGLGSPPANSVEAVARAPISACRALGFEAQASPPNKIVVAGRAIGTVELVRVDEVSLLRGRLWLEVDGDRLGRIEEQFTTDSTTSFSQHLAPGKGFPEVADALVAAIEKEHQLDLIPSMPTPAELDALLDWDTRLAGSGLRTGFSSSETDRIPA